MTFNIASKRAIDTAKIKIIDPDTGEQLIGEGGKPASITLHGPASKTHIAAQAAYNSREAKRFQAKAGEESTPDEILESKAAFLADITVSFDNFNYEGMTDGPEAWKACYADRGLGWLTNQAERKGTAWANFTPDSSGN